MLQTGSAPTFSGVETGYGDLFHFRYRKYHFRYRDSLFLAQLSSAWSSFHVWICNREGVSRSIICVYNQMNQSSVTKDILKTVKNAQIWTVLKISFFRVIQFTRLCMQSTDFVMPSRLRIQTWKIDFVEGSYDQNNDFSVTKVVFSVTKLV